MKQRPFREARREWEGEGEGGAGGGALGVGKRKRKEKGKERGVCGRSMSGTGRGTMTVRS